MLIFVSLGERYARIVADDGIAAGISDEAMARRARRCCSTICRGACRRRLRRGNRGMRALAAPHAPPNDENELPDKVYVL